MTEAIAPITVDDLKQKALHIRDMAEVEVRRVAEDRRTQIIVVGVVALVAVVSMAYYLGSRRQ
jgi:hypothetical protein